MVPVCDWPGWLLQLVITDKDRRKNGNAKFVFISI